MRFINEINFDRYVSDFPNINIKNTGLLLASIDAMPVCYYGKPGQFADGRYSFYMSSITIPKGFKFRAYSPVSDSIVVKNDNKVEENVQVMLIFGIKRTEEEKSQYDSTPAHDVFEETANRIAEEKEKELQQKVMMVGSTRGCVGNIVYPDGSGGAEYARAAKSDNNVNILLPYYEFYSDRQEMTFSYIPIILPSFTIIYCEYGKIMPFGIKKEIALEPFELEGVKAFSLLYDIIDLRIEEYAAGIIVATKLFNKYGKVIIEAMRGGIFYNPRFSVSQK